MAIEGIADTLQGTAPAAQSAPAERSPAPAPAPAPAQPSADAAEVAAAIDRANKALGLADRSVEFQFDKETGRMVVQVIDKETGSVVRQFPSEDMLEIARAIDREQGVLLHLKA